MSNFVRQRGFLDPSRLLHAPQFSVRQNNMNAPMDPSIMSNTNLMNNLGGHGEMSSNTQVLWGTNINTSDLQIKLKEFLTTFTIMIDDDVDMNEMERFNQEPHYIKLLKQIAETEDYTLEVDCDHLYEFNPSLYRQLEDYPTDVIPIFDLIAL